MSQAIPISEARDDLGGIVTRVAFGGERVALSKNGKNVAVIVSVSDAELLERLEDERDVAEAEKLLADPKQKPRKFVPRR